MHPETGYEFCKFSENRAGDTSLWGEKPQNRPLSNLYILHATPLYLVGCLLWKRCIFCFPAVVRELIPIPILHMTTLIA